MNVGDLSVGEDHFHVGLEVPLLGPEVAAAFERTAFCEYQSHSVSKFAEGGYA